MSYNSKYTGEQIESKLNILTLDGDGSKFLSDNGTYKTISSEAPTNSGIELYSSDSINYSDITLSQSVEFLKKIDICGGTDSQENIFMTIYNPNNSIINLHSSIQEGGELIIKSKQYEVSGTSIRVVPGVGGMSSISNNGIATIDGDYFIGIYKIIGYEF